MSNPPASRPTIQASIDSVGLTWRHWLYLAVIFLLVLADGMDVTIVGQVFPAFIKTGWATIGASIPTVLAVGYLIMGVGAFIGGRLGDLWGRKIVLIVATLFFGAATTLSATASDFTVWTIWRWVACIGIGAVIPTANALLADLTPSKSRVSFLSIGYAGVGLGTTVGALLAGVILPAGGWQALLVTTGLIPVGIIVLTAFLVPESPTYYAARGKIQQAKRVLARLVPTANLDLLDFTVAKRIAGDRREAIAVILSRRYLLSTVLLFVFGFFSLGSQLMVNQYLPTLLESKEIGFSIPQTATITGSYGLASVISALVIGAVLIRASRWWTILVATVVAAAVAIIVGTSGVSSFAGLWVLLTVAGFFLPAVFGPTRSILTAPTYSVKVRGRDRLHRARRPHRLCGRRCDRRPAYRRRAWPRRVHPRAPSAAGGDVRRRPGFVGRCPTAWHRWDPRLPGRSTRARRGGGRSALRTCAPRRGRPEGSAPPRL